MKKVPAVSALAVQRIRSRSRNTLFARSRRIGVADMTFLRTLAKVYTGKAQNKEIVEAAYNVLPDLGEIARCMACTGLAGLRRAVPASRGLLRPWQQQILLPEQGRCRILRCSAVRPAENSPTVCDSRKASAGRHQNASRRVVRTRQGRRSPRRGPDSNPVHTAAAELVKKGGLAFRFPRFVGLRDDRLAEQATTAREIYDIYRSDAPRRVVR